ncbi:1-phosphatidylinositol-3-phosphate 5-kinase fab1a [Phtheirospermum japonicum]|uniref:1-phosphatidylinositol-3-phosphate 5-kinase n=1 Tax=Phtheirospermum japonicum TaxID=374723 RepID=A0A830CEZ7_9LAMI|nr:1-phosphatidylinositol-3-phosphate 5-kinase fab1a [Phtheirospermum japonicum]
MGSHDSKKLSEIVDIVKWIPRRTESTTMSRDFWMPDESCRVCYECDSQFNIFNRKHHCRLCGRVFCARCTTNSVPAPSDEPKNGREDGDRIRVCNYCFKQWKLRSAAGDNMMFASSPGLSPSPSSSSLVSSQSSCSTCNSGSSAGSVGYSTGPFQHVSCAAGQSPCQTTQIDSKSEKQERARSPIKLDYIDARDLSDQSGSCSRSDDDDDDYPVCRSYPEATYINSSDMGYGTINYSHTDCIYDPREVHPNEENTHPTCTSILLPEDYGTQGLECATSPGGEEADLQSNHVQSDPPPLETVNGANFEAVDYENNGLIWLPPDPDDEEDERETLISDDDDDDDAGKDATGEWGYVRSSSFVVGECRSRDRSNEEHRKAMKRVVDGHFRSLITQLLQTENLPVTEHEGWLDIITTLSWEAASLLKPDTSRGGGMDPGGYVKVKCIACGRRNESWHFSALIVLKDVTRTFVDFHDGGTSMVIKGVVCKKNVAHRRMTSKIDKARLFLLGGALEYQRVVNHLSSFDTLLQQEMDHLKMAVAKISAHQPNILLVEKSVSRYAQEYLLAKNISLVLNIKRPLLERIARCTGAQIIPSIDNVSAPKLGCCDSFHVEKFLEDLGPAGQVGKKSTKTLMFFEGCPRPLGCTILLKGASGDELKKVKHVVHYGVFAAYHLALETSFLADEGASLPEFPLKSPLTVALPNKPTSIDRSISMIPGYSAPSSEKPQAQQQPSIHSRNDLFNISHPSGMVPISEAEIFLSQGSNPQTPDDKSAIRNMGVTDCDTDFSNTQSDQLSAVHNSKENGGLELSGCHYLDEVERNNNIESSHFFVPEVSGQHFGFSPCDENKQPSHLDSSQLVRMGQHDIDHPGELGTLKEDFPPSPSDNQSILVSLSTRCVWKGSVCERAHLFRIKYYGNFDKPLGRFLQDHLFDQGYRCRSCEMPSEAHIHCYTHQEGSLTISVKKLQEFLLPGEREGKIWMWHRCLQCPRTNGLPPSTKRVVMSDAAWGLSFGKFLELSFSNHAAASRVASCGHSLHRDCLRFYGFGRMVACFRYAPIIVHSVYLPPPKLEFNYCKQEWIWKEYVEVHSRGDLLFTEVLEVLHQILHKVTNDTGTIASESSQQIAELEMMLQKEKKGFEEVKSGKPEIDILEINRLKRQLVLLSYVWDQRLIHVFRSNVQIPKEKPVNSREKQTEMDMVSRFGRGFSSWDSSLVNLKPDVAPTDVDYCQSISPNGIHKGTHINRSLSYRQDSDHYHSSVTNLSNQSAIPEIGKNVRRARSEGQFPVMEYISDNLDAAMTGNNHSETVPFEDGSIASSNTLPRESSSGMISTAVRSVVNCAKDRFDSEEVRPLRSPLPAKAPNDMENPSSWLRIPFSALYRSFTKSFLTNAQRLSKISEYSPVYISSFREVVHQGGARLLLPTSSSDTVVPIFDDEPTSIISYALVSTDYQNFMSEDPEKQKDSLKSSSSLSILDSVNLLSLHSFDESHSESLRSLSSADESILSAGSRSFLGLDPLLFPNALHARVSFSDDGPPGKVKYTVTCYFAKQFEALRRTCCASELDFIRSLSRCKKWGAQGGKSNVFFAKTLDDRFIIKQVTKTELESFIKFAPSYFKYLSESIDSGCPTCLAKILGIYQIIIKPELLWFCAQKRVTWHNPIVPCHPVQSPPRSGLSTTLSLSQNNAFWAQNHKISGLVGKLQIAHSSYDGNRKLYMEDSRGSGLCSCSGLLFKFATSLVVDFGESVRKQKSSASLVASAVTSKHLKGGKESKMDVLVMENLLFRRNITRLYDLKGSSRSRYNPDSSGSNKVLLDQNLIEAMPTSPIFLGTKAKRLLERAVWNDTSFLASIDVMDYSLLVGVDEERHELVVGIIDFMRQYTWDKHLETWVKASGILGGPKNASPTVISPIQYKKRFRKAMSAYFLMVPDQWPSLGPMIPPNGSQSDLCEEKLQDRVSIQ